MTHFSQVLPNGKYMVKLHFAETYQGITGPGQRVFSFNVEGHEFKDFDVWVKAGGDLRAYAKGLPEDRQRALARRYAELFAVFMKHSSVVTRVTFRGVADGDSWLNNWPVHGRTNYPLIFDREGKPKLACASVIGAAAPQAAHSVVPAQ